MEKLRSLSCCQRFDILSCCLSFTMLLLQLSLLQGGKSRNQSCHVLKVIRASPVTYYSFVIPLANCSFGILFPLLSPRCRDVTPGRLHNTCLCTNYRTPSLSQPCPRGGRNRLAALGMYAAGSIRSKGTDYHWESTVSRLSTLEYFENLHLQGFKIELIDSRSRVTSPEYANTSLSSTCIFKPVISNLY